jgi:4-hydroxyphenylpyruvate dioxygenase
MSEQKAVNHLGLDGIEFVEYSAEQPEKLQQLFRAFGFSRKMKHKTMACDYYNQADIHFLVNTQPSSFARDFAKDHGPCISSMGWRVEDAKRAFDKAITRGAKPAERSDYVDEKGQPIPAIMGIGESLIYFIDKSLGFGSPKLYESMGFIPHHKPITETPKGFEVIDHLTNNVHEGTMERWSNFYREIFGFVEVRYFDIRGIKTGLTSYALRSPCGKFCIPINEASDKKSQINEYLEEYKGPGVQHLAFGTNDIIKSVAALADTEIETLDIEDEYYQEVFDRVPNVSEDHQRLKELQILVDGDDEGYLLQIFTRNVIGPIFIEIIQRKNHFAFGEGNFGALFRSIERDQQRRGYLD